MATVVNYRDTVLATTSPRMTSVSSNSNILTDFANVNGTTKPADNADVTVTVVNGGIVITGGGITLSAGGSIKGGQTGYATGTGFFLGYTGAVYKFSIGSSTSYLTWDGTTATFKGAMKAGPSDEFQVDTAGNVSAVKFVGSVSTFGNLYNPALPSITVGSSSSQPGISASAYIKSTVSSGDSAVWGEASSVAHGLRGRNTTQNTSGIVGGANGWNFYADGTSTSDYGTFTGGHDAVMLLGDEIEVGDLVVDVEVIAKYGMSQTISKITRSTAPMQKAVCGAFAGAPCTFDDFTPTTLYHCPDVFYAIKDTHRPVIYNALGEGQLNVCGENGDLEIGDWITTSSTPGKGMRQLVEKDGAMVPDPQVQNYTVAKCREKVTFSSPDEVKLIAVYYVAG